MKKTSIERNSQQTLSGPETELLIPGMLASLSKASREELAVKQLETPGEE